MKNIHVINFQLIFVDLGYPRKYFSMNMFLKVLKNGFIHKIIHDELQQQAKNAD